MTSQNMPFLSPSIRPDSLPKSERKSAWLIEQAVDDLNNFVKEFRSALALFDFCTGQQQAIEQRRKANASRPNDPQFAEYFGGWRFVAARDGAMSIYHFGKTLEGIRANLGSCPAVRPWVDSSALRLAAKRFDNYFPQFVAMRHAVAHAGELTRGEKNFDKHSFTGNYTGPGIEVVDSAHMSIRNSLFGRTYTATFDGQVATYEISGTTLSHLGDIKEEIVSVFRKVEAASIEAAKGLKQP
jgi:hypothetical protein